jgi:hypothetical protein
MCIMELFFIQTSWVCFTYNLNSVLNIGCDTPHSSTRHDQPYREQLCLLITLIQKATHSGEEKKRRHQTWKTVIENKRRGTRTPPPPDLFLIWIGTWISDFASTLAASVKIGDNFRGYTDKLRRGWRDCGEDAATAGIHGNNSWVNGKQNKKRNGCKFKDMVACFFSLLIKTVHSHRQREIFNIDTLEFDKYRSSELKSHVHLNADPSVLDEHTVSIFRDGVKTETVCSSETLLPT